MYRTGLCVHPFDNTAGPSRPCCCMTCHISRSCDVNAAVPLQIPNKQGELELVTLLQAAERNNSVEIVQLIKEQVSVDAKKTRVCAGPFMSFDQVIVMFCAWSKMLCFLQMEKEDTRVRTDNALKNTFRKIAVVHAVSGVSSRLSLSSSDSINPPPNKRANTTSAEVTVTDAPPRRNATNKKSSSCVIL